MATAVLRPNADNGAANGWTVTGAASAWQALADDSDASYIDGNAATSQRRVEFTTVAIPALAQIRSLRPRVRYALTGVSSGAHEMRFFSPTGGVHLAILDTFTPSLSIAEYAGAEHATMSDGSAWSQAEIDAIIGSAGTKFYFGPPPVRMYEMYLDVTYNEAPVATVTGPTEGSIVTNDSQPSVTWTYSDPEGDTQERFHVKVFSAVQYGAGGFDPETSMPAWSSGATLSDATTVEIGTVLPNGVYRAYVKVADVGSGGRYGAWDFNQFTLDVDPPAVPVLTATADDTLKRVELTADSPGIPAVEFFDFEYSDDAGGTWTAVRDATRVAAVGTSATVYDYESPPNTPRVYRAMAGRTVA